MSNSITVKCTKCKMTVPATDADTVRGKYTCHTCLAAIAESKPKAEDIIITVTKKTSAAAPATVRLNCETLAELIQMLETAQGNAGDLLADHKTRFGSETRKNAVIAEMYENEICQIDTMLEILRGLK